MGRLFLFYLLAENKGRDGVDVLLLHALDLHLALQLRQRVDGEVAQIGQTREAVLRVLGVGAGRVGVVADAAHARPLDRGQLELADGLERGQLEHLELLLGADDHLVVCVGADLWLRLRLLLSGWLWFANGERLHILVNDL